MKYWVGGLLAVSAFIAFAVSIWLSVEYQRWVYLFTLSGGALGSICAVLLYLKARASSKFLSVQTLVLFVFLLSYTLEEFGWALWRSGVQPAWFEYSATGILKSIQGAAAIAYTVVTYYYLSQNKKHNYWDIAAITGSVVLLVGTGVSLIARAS